MQHALRLKEEILDPKIHRKQAAALNLVRREKEEVARQEQAALTIQQKRAAFTLQQDQAALTLQQERAAFALHQEQAILTQQARREKGEEKNVEKQQATRQKEAATSYKTYEREKSDEHARRPMEQTTR